MAPKRPSRVDLITSDGGDLLGVLVCRADGSEAQAMAIRALEVDYGWNHDRAVAEILAADITPGRWYKTPDREQRWGWLMVPARQDKAVAGATPAVYYRLKQR